MSKSFVNASLYTSSLASYGTAPLNRQIGLTCCQTGTKTKPCWQHRPVVNVAYDDFF